MPDRELIDMTPEARADVLLYGFGADRINPDGTREHIPLEQLFTAPPEDE